MKIGMNDPCPCGSGKKYKKCCWNREFYVKKRKRDLDNLYALLKGYNDNLLKKANLENYTGANFSDAIDLTITSNALSLIKGIFQNNHYSITNALNLRNLIECYALICMDERGDISDTKKLLFVQQYKLIEHETYSKGDSEKFKSLLDLNELNERYIEGKKKFLEVVGTESRLKKIINSRVPFLCDEKLNYNSLIEKYCPLLLQPYIYLSRMIHPSSYESFRNEEIYNKMFWVIMKLVSKRYKDIIPKETNLSYFQEQVKIYAFGIRSEDNYAQKLYDLQKGQWEILKTISKEFRRVYGGPNYVADFLTEVTLVLHDINTDSQLGYTENVKLKFKVIAEMFACFHKVYSLDDEEESYFYDMLYLHDIVKELEQAKQEMTDDEKDGVYSRYINYYPSSKLSRDDFFKEYNKQLGFLVDGEGNTPNLAQLVDEYFDNIFQEDLMSNKDIKIKDFFKLVYKESNNMSHGCGYLYFSNIGAWMDDLSVIQFLDNAVMNLLRHICIIFSEHEEESENNKLISELLKKSFIKMALLTKEKEDILMKIPRVEKNF